MPANGDQLELKRAPSVMLFFGLAGCGKTHVGQLVGALSQRFFYDADGGVTPAMAAALAAQQPFTQVMRDEFFELLVERILTLQQTHGDLVITQAVYKQKHREYLVAQVADLELIHVVTDEQLITDRLKVREGGISLASAVALRADFELPGPEVKRLYNDGDSSRIIGQLNRLYP